MKPLIFSCCFKCQYKDYLHLNQRSGQWYLGGFGMHVIRFILREFKPTPNPFWMGLLDSCMNTRTLWLHKGTFDKHPNLCSWCIGYCIRLEVQCVLLLVLLASALELILHFICQTCSMLHFIYLSPLNDPRVFTYLYYIQLYQ